MHPEVVGPLFEEDLVHSLVSLLLCELANILGEQRFAGLCEQGGVSLGVFEDGLHQGLLLFFSQKLLQILEVDLERLAVAIDDFLLIQKRVPIRSCILVTSENHGALCWGP